MEDDEMTPEYSGSFLFLVDLAVTFKKCNMAREAKNIQDLLINLEGLALMLTGYYSKKPAENKKIEDQIRKDIIKLREDLNKVLIEYGDTQDLKIPKDLWVAMFDFECKLRAAWKGSGLQMALRSGDDLGRY